MSPSLWQNNSLGSLEESKPVHETPYLYRRPRPSLLGSFSGNRQFLPQKCPNHQKEGSLFAGCQFQDRSTIFLSFRYNLHASYLLAYYQHYYQWYVYLFLLKVFSLFSLQISYFLASFGTTLLHAHLIHLSSTI